MVDHGASPELDVRIRAVTGGLLPSERRFELPGERSLHCLAWGEAGGPIALLLHGAGAHAHWWTPLVRGLDPKWHLHAIDLRGHGRSDWVEPPSYQVRDFVDDAIAVLAQLTATPAVVIGHSMGGRAASLLAAERPDLVRGLVLLDARVNPADGGAVAQWNEAMMSRRRGRIHATREEAEASFRVVPDEPDIPRHIADLIAAYAVIEVEPGGFALRNDRAGLAAIGDRVGGMRDVLARIACPTVMACGAETHMMSPAEAAGYAAAMPLGRLEMVPGRHHFPLSHPEETTSVVRAALAAL